MAKTEEVTKEEKPKSKLEQQFAKLNKDYGKGTVMFGNQKPEKCDVVSTGSLSLDIATGIMGLPRGRIVEIYGPESSGKTTLSLHTIANAQKLGRVAFIDMEHALDLSYAKALGVNINDLVISQPDYGEQALNIIRDLAITGEFSAIVLDSIAALVPKSEYDGEVGSAAMGGQARMLSQGFRMITGYMEKTNTLLVMTNQIRYKIGVMFGSPETTSGGESTKFYTSMRLDVRRQLQKDGDEIVGGKTVVTVKKNKLAPPFKKGEFFIKFGEGINREREIVDIASSLNIINQAGSWYSYGETKIGQGVDNVVNLLKDNPELSAEIETKINTQIQEQWRK